MIGGGINVRGHDSLINYLIAYFKIKSQNKFLQTKTAIFSLFSYFNKSEAIN